MIYKILLLVSDNANGKYYKYLQVNNADYSTTDLVVLEAKILELMQTLSKNEIKIVTEHSFTDDLTIS